MSFWNQVHRRWAGGGHLFSVWPRRTMTTKFRFGNPADTCVNKDLFCVEFNFIERPNMAWWHCLYLLSNRETARLCRYTTFIRDCWNWFYQRKRTVELGEVIHYGKDFLMKATFWQHSSVVIRLLIHSFVAKDRMVWLDRRLRAGIARTAVDYGSVWAQS